MSDIPLTADADDVSAMSSLRVRRDSPTLTQMVVDQFRTAILNGIFSPGERLIERKLCEMTGVSRTAVREALRSLESEGIVVNVPNRGPAVATVGLREAKDMYAVRRLLEPYIAELFIMNMTASDLVELEASLVAMTEANEQNDFIKVNEAKTRFYGTLIAVADNTVVSKILGQLYAKVTILRHMTMSQDKRLDAVIVELTEVCDAIAARDTFRARRACEVHVDNAREVALSLLTAS